ncbi:MAG: crossover junction endodeoxyribonuclease RuvC [Planctomycetales bacterium]
MKKPRVLGVDPGLNVTGYAVLEVKNGKLQVCEAGIVRGRSRGSLAERVHQIHQGITDVIEALEPEVLALEELFSHCQRPRTSILMGHARGVVCLAAAQAGIMVHNYAATQVKRNLTGNGRATKSQMQLAVQRELQLGQLPEPADVADALAIALCHHYLANRPVQI